MALIENAITLLKEDHLKVKAMFKALKAADALDIGGRDRLFAALKKELDIHTEVEETIFYPAVRMASSGSDDMVDHSYEEHGDIKKMLQQLASEQKGTEEWSKKLEQLEIDVEHHVREEEDVLLPQAEKALGDGRLKELGREILAEKEKLKETMS